MYTNCLTICFWCSKEPSQWDGLFWVPTKCVLWEKLHRKFDCLKQNSKRVLYSKCGSGLNFGLRAESDMTSYDVQAQWAFTADEPSLLANYQYNAHVLLCLNYFVSFSNGNFCNNTIFHYATPSTSHDDVALYEKLILVSNNKHWLSKNAHTANTISETLDQPAQRCWSIFLKNI